jgi:hypothetical protein
MEEQIVNAIVSEQPASRRQAADGEKTRQENQVGHLKPQPGAPPDIKPIKSAIPAEAAQSESSEVMLHQLLMTTEASAERTQSSRRKWQLTSLMLAMVLIPAVAVIGWLYVEMNVTGKQRGRLQMENQSLREQLNTAGTQITSFKSEMEAMLSRNIELTNDNTKLKSLSSMPIAIAPAVKIELKPAALNAAAAPAPTPDAGRIEAIKKGKYPSGTTRTELITVLGEPDRVYKARGYEQLVYFGHKPGRFWLIGNWLVETSE